ncbi:unnamed protein product [Anisakis simplex]|uniref:TPR_REGION domain-containing protein n=2 Tax=Anisakis simplex TaxID=6269 RepID=A0A0M3J0Z2_ANISI|nr:unnamed protein product [Anisakis simplex]
MAKNALLNAKIDNSVEVNAIDVLKDFKSSSIEPNIDTFAALSRIYALKGDVVGIVEIINHMKEAGIASDQRIIESMIYALALSDRDEQALSIIKSFSTTNQTFSEEAKLRISYANAKASKGDIDNALKIFDGVSERLRIRSKENSNLMLNILFTLLEKHDWNGAEKLKSLLNLDEDGKFSDYIEFTTVLGRIRQYRDQKEANVEGAIYLFKLLPEKYARTQRDFFKSYLFDKLKQSSDVDESVQLGVQLEQADILKNPRRILIDHALANNRARFYELYEKFLKSDEFKRLGKRAHLAYPYIVHSLNQLSNSSNEKKVEIFVHIASALFKWEQPEMRFLKQWFMEPLMKNSSVLTEVMCEICKDEKIRSNIASMVIDHLLFRNKFKEVTELLDG